MESMIESHFLYFYLPHSSDDARTRLAGNVMLKRLCEGANPLSSPSGEGSAVTSRKLVALHLAGTERTPSPGIGH
ncbi:hypothetical protein SADUNF_Sadunf10G0022600 [Salix dunnii]|uniref:Uncharacterized protein n=1 Tax=Salix dunnii TaxID=1413687 RepID=A0A835JPX0_9ROSI|nr:hypothetical protein SADUNF_Sadunf10G0022600 [Salix dunnii]